MHAHGSVVTTAANPSSSARLATSHGAELLCHTWYTTSTFSRPPFAATMRLSVGSWSCAMRT